MHLWKMFNVKLVHMNFYENYCWSIRAVSQWFCFGVSDSPGLPEDPRFKTKVGYVMLKVVYFVSDSPALPEDPRFKTKVGPESWSRKY